MNKAHRLSREDGVPVAKDDLTVAKINAALKILEWSKDNIEPGISGNPHQLHVALAEAFRTVYAVVCESVGPVPSSDGEADGQAKASAADEDEQD